MASEAYYLTQQAKRYDTYAQRWLANILGANSWGSSFIVGDGSTFPNCIQHQVANLAGALDGTSGGTPMLWGAATEGPDSYTTSGVVGGMILCPANGVDTFKKFNGNAARLTPSQLPLLSGQRAVLQHDRAGHRPYCDIVSDVVLENGEAASLLRQLQGFARIVLMRAFFVDRISLPYRIRFDFAELRRGSNTPRPASGLPPSPVISAG